MLHKKSIKDLEENLQNGFHDAKLNKIDIDYEKRIAILDVAVDISKIETVSPEYRKGKIIISGLVFCILEPPEIDSLVLKNEGLWISGSDQISLEELPIKKAVQLPERTFAHRFFMNDLNAFLYIVAMDSQFEWF